MNIKGGEGDLRFEESKDHSKENINYYDLIEMYENPIEHACQMSLGQTFIANGWERPDGFRPVSFLLEAMDEDAE